MSFQIKRFWITEDLLPPVLEALAYEFASQGAKLVLSSHKEGGKVAKGCNGRVILIQTLDLAEHEVLPGIVTSVLSKVGKVDILVNNAGISQRALVKDALFEVDKKMIQINLLGTIALSKALLPHFLQNQNGHFVVISSLMGKFAAPLRSSYAAAKHGLHGFFDVLRAETFKQNIKVTIVCPGFIKTDISKNALTASGQKQGTMDDATDKGMTPENLAKKILKAVRKEKEEVVFGGTEILAVYIKRFFPSLLSKIIRSAKVT
ncbi:MAG: SDR family NAD(P)-dependent oxidoreductase [Saprospiraceae bacterium]